MSNLLRTAGVHEWRVRSQGGVVTEALQLSDRTDLINEIIARSIIELAKAGSATRTCCARARCGAFGSSEDQATTIRSRRCREAIDALRFERKSGPYGRPAMNVVHAAAAMLALLSLCTIGQRPAAAEIHRPWCVGYVATITFSCTFVSFEQCMETARGGGGSCVQNPWFLQYGERGQTTDAKQSSGRGKRR
jgi:hypothetical protein